MQEALSGELKRKKLSLDSMVRVLQAKAEGKGDPQFLRAKIEELLKKNRKEEEKKKRKIGELKDTVANLSKENKEMRKELRFIRESIERKNSAYLPEDSYLKKGKRGNRNSIEEDGYLPDGTYPTDGGQRSRDVPRCLATSPKEESPVMRLMLGGKSVPIPNSNLKQRNMVNKVKERTEESRKKTYY